MKRRYQALTVSLLLALTAVSLYAAWNAARPNSRELEHATWSGTISPAELVEALTRKDDGKGGVWVSVLLMTEDYFHAIGKPGEAAKYELRRYFVFRISVFTHNVDISAYNLRELMTLRDDKGNQYLPTYWLPSSDASHHRSGYAAFPRLDPENKPIVGANNRYIEIAVMSLAGVPERVFRWNLPLPSLGST